MGYQNLLLFLVSILVLVVVGRVLFSWWILPNLAYFKLRRNGFGGPIPSFPLGNISEMITKIGKNTSQLYLSPNITHDIHSLVFPYFARWQKSHGKVFVYWLGTEPFLCIADPQFLKEMSGGVMGKSWGKPTVFKIDRKPMFGNGLVMVEGEDWVRHRHVITPAFSPTNLKVSLSRSTKTVAYSFGFVTLIWRVK